jgi:hypothetical protein
MSQQGWIGVDLDRTLAHYDVWRGLDHIGEPIPTMLALVKLWLKDGKDVRIFTARVSTTGPEGYTRDAELARSAIDAWCLKHIGQTLPVTNVKDFSMVILYDDRAIQVEANTGRLIG